MTTLLLTQLLVLLAATFTLLAFAARWRSLQRRPFAPDRAPARGAPADGVRYAFTLGMMPWAKESTRLHLLAYLRGIGFHVGIFGGLAALLCSPGWPMAPHALLWCLAAIAGLGAVFGLLGEIARWMEPGLRALSTPDDHASVLVVTAFLGATGAALINPAWLPAMYVASALMLIYAPAGKIRHCIYFFFSRQFFGLFLGRRGVLQHGGAQ